MSKPRPKTGTANSDRGKVTFSKRLAAVQYPERKEDNLELLTVEELQRALQAADGETLASISAAADNCSEEGIIARRKESGAFTVISDAEILALQEQTDASLADLLGQQSVTDGDEHPESALLSTQMFRNLMGSDD